MKNITNLIIAFLLIGLSQGYSQSMTFHDPTVQNPSVEIKEKSEEGKLSFQFIQQLSDYATLNEEQPIRMVVSLMNIKPKDGIYSIKGSYAQNFEWQYDAEMNYFLATQKGRLAKDKIGNIEMEFVVLNAPSCDNNQRIGFNVNIQPAACMNGVNEIDNDNVSTYTCQPALSTSLEELAAATYKIFPNPTTEFVNIQLNHTPEALTIEIINTQGKIVQQDFFEKSNAATIDISQLPAGTYSIQIKTDEKFASEKIIIIQ